MKTVIITGANSGIGKAAAKLLCMNDRIILICRNEKSGNEALNEIADLSKNDRHELLIMDLCDATSIKEGAAKIREKCPTIDAIIHNAAIFDITQKGAEANMQGIETVFFTNYIAPVLLTKLLMGNLEAGDRARVVTIGSKGLLAMPFLSLNFENPEFKKKRFSITRNYYHSKLALLTWTASMSDRYKNSRVTFNAIRVPSVAVDLTRYKGLSDFSRWLYAVKSRKALTPERMAETYKYAVDDDGFGFISGQYINEMNERVPFPKTCEKKDEWSKLDVMTQEYMKYLLKDE